MKQHSNWNNKRIRWTLVTWAVKGGISQGKVQDAPHLMLHSWVLWVIKETYTGTQSCGLKWISFSNNTMISIKHRMNTRAIVSIKLVKGLTVRIVPTCIEDTCKDGPPQEYTLQRKLIEKGQVYRFPLIFYINLRALSLGSPSSNFEVRNIQSKVQISHEPHRADAKQMDNTHDETRNESELQALASQANFLVLVWGGNCLQWVSPKIESFHQ